MKRIVLVALMVVAGPALAGKTKPAPSPADETRAIVDSAKAVVLERLKDPDSAKFRNVFISKKPDTVCGELNSKNAMGGYTGYQRFMVEEGRPYFDDDGPSFPGAIDMACQK